jgi:SPP1 gp7 family putative phage head morphogenesis protein
VFESELESINKKVIADVQKAIRSGMDVTDDYIKGLYRANGYDDLIETWVTNYNAGAPFLRGAANELQIPFEVSDAGMSNLEALQDIDYKKLKTLNDQVAIDMAKMNNMGSLDGKGVEQIIKEMSEKITDQSRRIATEAYTSMSMATAAIDKDFFEGAGIDKYVYMGPEDNKTRDACRDTLSDERQGTGWTMTDIESSQTPYIERGGFNCRHRWLPYVDDD